MTVHKVAQGQFPNRPGWGILRPCVKKVRYHKATKLGTCHKNIKRTRTKKIRPHKNHHKTLTHKKYDISITLIKNKNTLQQKKFAPHKNHHKTSTHKKNKKYPTRKKIAAHKKSPPTPMQKLNTKTLSYKKIRRQKPYWNFWKVVFAGWLIRYPKTFAKLIGIPIGFILVMIYNASR